MTTLADLDTPVVTVDLDIMRDNIRRVQAHLSRHGIGNRPHIKTHKIPEIGKMQIAAGATGITCQKLGEVEVFVDAGVTDDILLTFNILGEPKTDRLMALVKRVRRLAVVEPIRIRKPTIAFGEGDQLAGSWVREIEVGSLLSGIDAGDAG